MFKEHHERLLYWLHPVSMKTIEDICSLNRASCLGLQPVSLEWWDRIAQLELEIERVKLDIAMNEPKRIQHDNFILTYNEYKSLKGLI